MKGLVMVLHKLYMKIKENPKGKCLKETTLLEPFKDSIEFDVEQQYGEGSDRFQSEPKDPGVTLNYFPKVIESFDPQNRFLSIKRTSKESGYTTARSSLESCDCDQRR